MSLFLEMDIEEKRNTLKTDRLDMSFGEIMNMYKDNEIIINPDFQRSFRWSKEKQTNFLESILLNIPIPSIFVAENSEGQWELVDGLQRISSILSFFGFLDNIDQSKNNLVLEPGQLIESLKGTTINTIPLKFKLTLKRAVCRVEILRWDSNMNMKYELFKRLNTTSEPLSDQEMRNAVFSGRFNNFINKLSKNENFVSLMKPSNKQKSEMYLEELILRFYAFQESLDMPKGVKHHLDEFMDNINKDDKNFNYQEEEVLFLKLISFIKDNSDNSIFTMSNGQVTKNIYDSLIYILNKQFDIYSNNFDLFLEKVEVLKNDEEYQRITTKKRESRTRDRILRAVEIFNDK